MEEGISRFGESLLLAVISEGEGTKELNTYSQTTEAALERDYFMTGVFRSNRLLMLCNMSF